MFELYRPLGSRFRPNPLRFKLPKCRLSFSGAVLFLAACGCASVSFDDFKDVPASRCPQREEKKGIILSCRPITASQEVEFFFGTDLWEYGILPVTVHVENRSDGTVTFHPDRTVLRWEDGTELKTVPWRTVYEDVKFSYLRSLPGFLFALIPGFVIIHSVSAANERLSHNYHQKALEEFSLPPGDRVQGVLFLRPPEGTTLDRKKVEGSDLKLAFTSRDKSTTSSFEMFFHVWGTL